MAKMTVSATDINIFPHRRNDSDVPAEPQAATEENLEATETTGEQTKPNRSKKAKKKPSSDNSSQPKMRRKISKRIINYRCSDRTIFYISISMGVLVLFIQAVTLATDSWVFVVEPRVPPVPQKETDEDKARSKELLFYRFETGYWRTCREVHQPDNWNFSRAVLEIMKNQTAECVAHDNLFVAFVVGVDDSVPVTSASATTAMIGTSIAMPDILKRLGFSADAHAATIVLSVIATYLSFFGYLRTDNRTILGGIMYVVSGLFICVSVMQFICVVDDEMAPRLRATSEGEPSYYTYNYGWSMHAAMTSFLGLQACALANIVLFLRRYPGIEGKIAIVPGLRDRISKLQAISTSVSDEEFMADKPPGLQTSRDSLLHCDTKMDYSVTSEKGEYNNNNNNQNGTATNSHIFYYTNPV